MSRNLGRPHHRNALDVQRKTGQEPQTTRAGRKERVSGGESGGKPVEAPKAKPRIVPKKKIVEDEVNFPPPSKRRR
jgi:hypothetical protein